MRIINDEMAIALWERTARLAPIDRAVQMLTAVSDNDAYDAADVPIDQRDRILIEARCQTYGTIAEFYAHCPACEEALETKFDLSLLLEAANDNNDQVSDLKAPTSRMVAEAVRSNDRDILISACTDDPATDIDILQAELGKRFPLLHIEIDFECADCDHSFSQQFDPQHFLWEDINRHVARVFDEIHLLASCYGWRDSTILKMSRKRRNAYLARVSA